MIHWKRELWHILIDFIYNQGIFTVILPFLCTRETRESIKLPLRGWRSETDPANTRALE